MNITKVLIEFIVAFIIIYTLYYLFIIRKCKSKKMVPTEVTLILSFYEIDTKKIDLYQMTKVVSVVTTLILSLIITSIGIFFDSTIIILIFGTLLSLVIAVICYRIIGRYYEKKNKTEKYRGSKNEEK